MTEANSPFAATITIATTITITITITTITSAAPTIRILIKNHPV
jgi:hypothetical protein